MKRLRTLRYPVGDGPVVVVPAGRFVTRRIAIDPAVDVTEQVELAIEAFAPLPLAQLYWGYLAAPGHGQALVWIACRKHFSTGETAAWTSAAAVLPAMLLVARRPANASPAIVHCHEGWIQAAAWSDGSPLPATLLARNTDAEDEIIREARSRSGQAMAAPLRLEGAIAAGWRRKEAGLELTAGGFSAAYRWEELATADIRERGELAALQQNVGQRRLLWRASLAAAALIALAAGLDLARLFAGAGLSRFEASMRVRTTAVAAIQDAHALSQRLAQLSRQQLHFMEMLDLLNERRPRGLSFIRVASRGPHGLEVSARTQNADDARQFETALKGMPELGSVTVGNLSTRDGHTDFTVQAEFRAEAFGPNQNLGMP